MDKEVERGVAAGEAKRRRATWIAATAILLLLLFAIGVYLVNNRTAAVEAPPAPAAGIVDVSAGDLAAAYDRDPLAAERLYDGRTLNVTGRLGSRTAGPAGDPAVVLHGDNPLLDVAAAFDKVDAAAIDALQPASLVTLSCRRITFEVDTPSLSQCSIVRAVPRAGAQAEGNQQ